MPMMICAFVRLCIRCANGNIVAQGGGNVKGGEADIRAVSTLFFRVSSTKGHQRGGKNGSDDIAQNPITNQDCQDRRVEPPLSGQEREVPGADVSDGVRHCDP